MPVLNIHPMLWHFFFCLIALAGAVTYSGEAQTASPGDSDYQLLINGDVPDTMVVGPADLARLKQHSVKTKNSDGKTSVYKGPMLIDVLKLAGLAFGETMKGPRLASYLLVTCRDNYKVVIALPELDPAFTDKVILVATLKDGKPLPQSEGPLRIVIPNEKRQARWARQLQTLTIMRQSP